MSEELKQSYPVMEAVEPFQREVGGVSMLCAPPGWKVESLESIEGKHAPRYREGTARLHDLDSLKAYVERFAWEDAAVVYVDPEAFSVTCILDDEGNENAARRVDRAVVAVKQDPRFQIWQKLCAGPVSQKDLVRFIEMNESHFFDPDGATMRTLATQLELRRSVQFKNAEKMDGAARDVALQYETSTKEVGEIRCPSLIWIRVPIFLHQDKAEIPVKLFYDLEEGKVVFTLRIPDVGAIVERAWEQVEAMLTEKMGEMCPILKGCPPAPPNS